MPRRDRIDAPGALHLTTARGIERKRIFKDDQDREYYIERLGDIVTETKTFCFGWALIPNHTHILLRSGQTAPATVMRRLLTGCAVSYNRRHRRRAHFFQSVRTIFWRRWVSPVSSDMKRCSTPMKGPLPLPETRKAYRNGRNLG